MTLPSRFGPDLKTLVLAGSDPPASGAPARSERESPLPDKAFRLLRGRLVVEYVLELLQECGLRRIWVVAPDRQLARIPARHLITGIPQQPGARFFANLLAGSRVMQPQPDEPVLVVFGDHPVQAPNAFYAFLAACAEQLDHADFFHGLATQSAYREYGQWFHRTSVHMRGLYGRASGFNLAVPSRLHGLDAFNQLYGVRKLERRSSFVKLLWHLARATGTDAPHALLDALAVYAAKEAEKAARGGGRTAGTARRAEKWLADRVPGERLLRYAARVLGAERGVRLIPLAHGGIAIDVDFAEELSALEAHWNEILETSRRQDAALAR
jgi:hypothetical protein